MLPLPDDEVMDFVATGSARAFVCWICWTPQ